jgi:hypothetical protein
MNPLVYISRTRGQGDSMYEQAAISCKTQKNYGNENYIATFCDGWNKICARLLESKNELICLNQFWLVTPKVNHAFGGGMAWAVFFSANQA